MLYRLTPGRFWIVPSKVESPLPTTASEIEREMSLLIGALDCLQGGITRKDCDFATFPSLAYHVRRSREWLPSWRDRLRRVHRPAVPAFNGRPITSFTETAFDIGGLYLKWFRETIQHYSPVDPNQLEYQRLELERQMLVEEAEYIYRNWRFAPIALDALETYLGLELSWLPAPSLYPNYDRDKFIYDLRPRKTWKEIGKLLKGHTKWDPLSGESSIRNAANTYAERCDLPPLKRGKSGRPPKSE